PSLAMHWVWSLLRVLGSVIVAVLLGGLMALLPRWFPALEGIIHHLLKPFLISFPTVAWALLATIWFGVSTATVLFIQVVILVPYCLINISEGVRVLDPELTEMGRSFSRSPRRLMFRIILPQLLPYFIAALRIAYGVAWKIALIAEMFGAQSGLGYLMVRAQSYADGNTVLATCLVIVILFWAGDRLLISPLARRFGAQG
ncbi:MAG TPA: ABC transporter permease subunit, partial [Pusillimonas sp.]|uniref:ABC transporter permease n=1 Tax=Pusillimonas sp. TaxID=3040095 RepID=UPI002C6812B1